MKIHGVYTLDYIVGNECATGATIFTFGSWPEVQMSVEMSVSMHSAGCWCLESQVKVVDDFWGPGRLSFMPAALTQGF